MTTTQPNQMMLLFENLFDAVVSGQEREDGSIWLKRATMREGNRDFQTGPLQIEATENTRDPYVVNVTDVTHLTFDTITDEMAMSDGYKDANELKEIMVDIYVNKIKRHPELKPEHPITFIRYENPQKLENPSAEKPKLV